MGEQRTTRLTAARERLSRLDEIIDLAREWASPYATGCVYENVEQHHPLDCPRSNQEPGVMCFECANEALALGILALIGEDPSRCPAEGTTT